MSISVYIYICIKSAWKPQEGPEFRPQGFRWRVKGIALSRDVDSLLDPFFHPMPRACDTILLAEGDLGHRFRVFGSAQIFGSY